jgi:DNA polymerase-4
VLHLLPVTVLVGVGARTQEELARLGIRTVADLAATPTATLVRAIGEATALHLHELAHGRDPRAVRPDDVEKSISADRTLDVDLTAPADVHRELLRHADEVASRLRHRSLGARTVGIKIRFADFRTITRVRTLPNWTDDTGAIYSAAAQLYDALDLDRPRIRLVGVKAENLAEAASVVEQLSLDDEFAAAARRGTSRAATRAVDAARARFGAGAVVFGAHTGDREVGVSQKGDAAFRYGESTRMLDVERPPRAD